CTLTTTHGPALDVNHNSEIVLKGSTVSTSEGSAIQMHHNSELVLTDTRVVGPVGVSLKHKASLRMTGGEIRGQDAGASIVGTNYGADVVVDGGALIHGHLRLPRDSKVTIRHARVLGQLHMESGEVVLGGGARLEGEVPAISLSGSLRVDDGAEVLGGVAVRSGSVDLERGRVHAEGTVLEIGRNTAVKVGPDMVLSGIIDAPEGAEVLGLSPEDPRQTGADWLRDDWARAACASLWASDYAALTRCYSVSPDRSFQGRVEGELTVTMSPEGHLSSPHFDGLATEGVGACLGEHILATRVSPYSGGPAQVRCHFKGAIQSEGPSVRHWTRFLPTVTP
ncbi:MAG: hypothetical protein QF464_23300, partial [Myxococcota bacterium]|nr:hypothetical protein [Myxococcota bacterium]